MERKAQTLRSSRGVRPALPPVSNSSHLPPCTLRTCAKEPRHSLGQNFFQSADPPGRRHTPRQTPPGRLSRPCPKGVLAARTPHVCQGPVRARPPTAVTVPGARRRDSPPREASLSSSPPRSSHVPSEQPQDTSKCVSAMWTRHSRGAGLCSLCSPMSRPLMKGTQRAGRGQKGQRLELSGESLAHVWCPRAGDSKGLLTKGLLGAFLCGPGFSWHISGWFPGVRHMSTPKPEQSTQLRRPPGIASPSSVGVTPSLPGCQRTHGHYCCTDPTWWGGWSLAPVLGLS